MRSLPSTLILIPYLPSNHSVTNILSYTSFWNMSYVTNIFYIFQNMQTSILYNLIYTYISLSYLHVYLFY